MKFVYSYGGYQMCAGGQDLRISLSRDTSLNNKQQNC